MEYFVNAFQIFMLIFVRMVGVLVASPMFSSQMMPMRIKAMLAFFTTLLIFPQVMPAQVEVPTQLVAYVLVVLGEVAIGLLIGFSITLVFSVFQMSARFFSVQAGFGITETIDPLAQVSVPVLGQFQNLIATLVFIAVRGPSLVVRALYKSYFDIPILSDSARTVLTDKSETVIEYLLDFSMKMFTISLEIAFPIMATLFLLSLSLGLLAKAAPQMNILILGFPFQVGLAVITFLIVTPLLIDSFADIIIRTFDEVNILIETLGTVA